MGTTLTFAKKRFAYRTQKNSALFFSIVFHPVMLPTFFFIFACWMVPEILTPFSTFALQVRFLILIFITTMVIPVAMLSIHFALNKQKLSLNLLYLHERKARIYPFFYTALFYSGITYMFYFNLHLNVFICSFIAMVSFALLLISFISLFYKISAHIMALTAVAGYLILLQLSLPDTDLLLSICVMIGITGITASSRLFLQAHTPAQILAGCFVGLLSTCSCLLWLYV